MNSRSLTLMASHISLIFYEFQVSPFFFPVLKSPPQTETLLAVSEANALKIF